MEKVTLSEFARQIGRSKAIVSRMVKNGQIPRNSDGSIPLEDGLRAFEDYQNTPKNRGGRPSKASKAAAEKKVKEPQKKTAPQPKHKPIEEVEAAREEKRQSASDIHAALNKAKLADRTFQARLRELDFKMKSGELLEKNAVIAECQWLAEQVKSKLLAIPPRISSLCEGRIAREIEEIITDGINGALTELQKCKYTAEAEAYILNAVKKAIEELKG